MPTLAAFLLLTALHWNPSLPKAQQAARQADKPILVDVWAVWCAPCKQMEETTYRDAAVLRELEGFVPVKIDADANESFLERYRVEAFPTVLVLDARGKELGRREGYVGAEPFAAFLREILQRPKR